MVRDQQEFQFWADIDHNLPRNWARDLDSAIRHQHDIHLLQAVRSVLAVLLAFALSSAMLGLAMAPGVIVGA